MEINKRYKYVFFDLDHTLWDFDSNSKAVLNKLYTAYDLAKYGIQSNDFFVSQFIKTNEALWAQFNVGAIDKFYLRNERFRLVFKEAGAVMNLVGDEFLKEFNKQFLHLCARQKGLIDGAMKILEELHGTYPLFVITNGFQEVQSIKMEHSGIGHFFERVITSEKAGFKKPFTGIFNYAMKWTGANVQESLMIGDNLDTDIKGARDFGMDQVYFNPDKKPHDQEVTFEIAHLIELSAILK